MFPMCSHRWCRRPGVHAIHYFSATGLDTVTVCSRHASKARKLARQVGGEPIYHFTAWMSGMAPLMAWRVLRLPRRPLFLDPSERIEASGLCELVGLLATQPSYRGTALATDRRILIVDEGIAHHKILWSQITGATSVTLPGERRGLLLSVAAVAVPGYDLGVRPDNWDQWMKTLLKKGVDVEDSPGH